MIAGIGLDIVDLAGFRAQLADRASTFVEGTFTAAERDDCEGRASRDPARHLAARYAAKEAFLKAWSGGMTGAPALAGVDYREIEVVTDAWGRPSLRLHGTVARKVGECRLHVSLTHDGGYAAASVLMERDR
jgi:holo-[acyl-carrier protein] synthase